MEGEGGVERGGERGRGGERWWDRESMLPFPPVLSNSLLHRCAATIRDPQVLHRDLKTSNLLMNNRGMVCLCDFGLARKYADPLKVCTARFSTGYLLLSVYNLLFRIHYSRLTTHDSRLTAYYLLLATHHSLHTIHYSLLATHCRLLTACY